MNHKRFFTRGITLILVILVVSACAAPKATPPTPNAWRSNLSSMANVIFTFDPGDKCTMQIISQPHTAEFVYEIVVNDQSHLNYGLSGMTLNPGVTEADVAAWVQNNPNSDTPPPMMTMQLYDAVNSMSRTFHVVTYTGDPIYFVCITEGPDAHQAIASFDPLVMPTK